MTGTPTPAYPVGGNQSHASHDDLAPPGADVSHQRVQAHGELVYELLEELLWLTHDAHQRLQRLQRSVPIQTATGPWSGDLGERLGDSGYVLGQRNTYARAAGLLAARESGMDPVLAADYIIHALTEPASRDATVGAPTVSTLRAELLAGLPSANPARSLAWLEPQAFTARYGDLPGIDHDYGMRWGANHNQRISLRRPSDATHGMLYAYDPTWDEYALLRKDVTTTTVDTAFQVAVRRGEHLTVEDVAHLVTIEAAQRPPGRQPGRRPEHHEVEPVVLALEP